MSNTISHHDARYVESNDKEARFVAWAYVNMDMGGWTGTNRVEFLQAVHSLLADLIHSGEPPATDHDIIIQSVAPAFVEASGEWSADAETAVASAVDLLRSKLGGYDKAREYVTYGVHMLEHADGEFQASLALHSERLEHSEIYTLAHHSKDCVTLADPAVSASDVAGTILAWHDEDWFEAVA